MRSRRFNSRSMASRMKSAFFSLPSRTASMRASVPSRSLAGYCSSLILTRPTGRLVARALSCVNACTFPNSPLAVQKDISYLFRGYPFGVQVMKRGKRKHSKPIERNEAGITWGLWWYKSRYDKPMRMALDRLLRREKRTTEVQW